MECPKCSGKMKEIKVKIQDADSPVTSYQCAKCSYFDFEKKSINRAISEIKLKETPLAIKQTIQEIKEARERIKKGEFYTEEESKEILGI